MVNKISVDFSNVKDAGQFNSKRLPAGDYLATISSVEVGESKAGKPMVTFAFQLNDHKTAVFPYHCVLQENQLWKLRNVLLAVGVKVPKSKANVDVDRLVGKELGVSLEDDEYEGKERSTVEAVFPGSEVEGNEAPVKKESAPADTAAPEADDTDEDDLDELDL